MLIITPILSLLIACSKWVNNTFEYFIKTSLDLFINRKSVVTNVMHFIIGICIIFDLIALFLVIVMVLFLILGGIYCIVTKPSLTSNNVEINYNIYKVIIPMIILFITLIPVSYILDRFERTANLLLKRIVDSKNIKEVDNKNRIHILQFILLGVLELISIFFLLGLILNFTNSEEEKIIYVCGIIFCCLSIIMLLWGYIIAKNTNRMIRKLKNDKCYYIKIKGVDIKIKCLFIFEYDEYIVYNSCGNISLIPKNEIGYIDYIENKNYEHSKVNNNRNKGLFIRNIKYTSKITSIKKYFRYYKKMFDWFTKLYCKKNNIELTDKKIKSIIKAMSKQKASRVKKSLEIIFKIFFQ